MKAVVGLGNPGQQYQGTRHNVGFLVVGELARRFQAGSAQSKFEAELVDTSFTPVGADGKPGSAEKLILLAPQTYMNESGRSVGRLADFYDLAPADILVVCDDLNLEPGRLRLRGSGSAGGQNGLKSIIQHLGTEDFPRLRIGIGRPPGRQSSSNYVLSRFAKHEQEDIEHAIVTAADGVELWLRKGLNAAMNQVNASPPE